MLRKESIHPQEETVECFILLLPAAFGVCWLLLSMDQVMIVFADSPSFVRQEFTDGGCDWMDANYNFISNYCDNDIRAVSYMSDGNFLNATLWLSKPFEKSIAGPNRTFALLIDIDSDPYTGVGGFEYDAQITWNATTQTWMYFVQEKSVADAIRLLNDMMIRNYTNFFKEGNSYVDIFLDLSLLNFPEQYRIEFLLVNGDGNQDFTDYIPVPPAQFNLSASPNPFFLRPGEEAKGEVRISSISNTLGTDIVFNGTVDHGIEINFVPDKVSLGSSGTSISIVKVKILENLPPRTYIIPILAKLTFPYENIVFGPERNIALEKNLEHNLAVTVLPPLEFRDYLDLLVEWISPLNTIWALVVAIVTAIVTLVFRMRRNKPRTNERIDSYF